MGDDPLDRVTLQVAHDRELRIAADLQRDQRVQPGRAGQRDAQVATHDRHALGVSALPVDDPGDLVLVRRRRAAAEPMATTRSQQSG